MGEDARAGGAAMTGAGTGPTVGVSADPVAASGDPEQIRREIEETREQLGETVEALAAKTDVKRHAQERVQEVRATVTEKKDELLGAARSASPETVVSAATQASEKARANPLPVAVGGAFLAGLLLGRILGRRRAY